MAEKEYMVFFEDMSRKTVKGENILAALQNITPIETVIRISLHQKDKLVISDKAVDEDFESQDEFRPAANM